MGWWKADPAPASTQSPASPPSASPAAKPHPPATTSSADACPVDPKTRSLWLQHAQAQAQAQAKSQSQSTTQPPNTPPLPQSTSPSQTPQPTTPLTTRDCSSNRITGQSLSPPPTSTTPPIPGLSRPLSNDRAISTIPRSLPNNTSSPSTTTPSNAETESGLHPSGNWIYPSESQFLSAVLRKQTPTDPTALASSISHIIPLHNAVNERAWTLIKQWEAPHTAAIKGCTGPKLEKFEGKGAGAQTPRAKWNSWVKGKREPFDRHDWTVERCGGGRVEYVIDFYEGRGNGEMGRVGPGGEEGKGVSFYLDVRPKLNSWEGVRMRVGRYWGWE